MTNASCCHRRGSSLQGFQGDAALSFHPWVFLHRLLFITLCSPFLKLPPRLSWVLISVGVPAAGLPSPLAAGRDTSITCPGRNVTFPTRGAGQVLWSSFLPVLRLSQSGSCQSSRLTMAVALSPVLLLFSLNSFPHSSPISDFSEAGRGAVFYSLWWVCCVSWREVFLGERHDFLCLQA